MIRKIHNTIFILALSATLAFSQTVQDFTVTDIHGNTHELYADYLDQGKTVVIDFFWVNCPLCQNLAPSLQSLYEEWGAGNYDVQFMALTIKTYDDDADVLGFDNVAGVTYPSISAEGGAIEAGEPFLDDEYGVYEGSPSIAVISPDGTVTFDIFGGTPDYIVNATEQQIIDSGARHPSDITDVEDALPVFDELMVFPNPVRDFASVNFNLNENADVDIKVFSMLGQSAMEVFKGNKYPGYHQVDFNPSSLSPGTYFIRIAVNDSVQTTRFIKLQNP